MVRPPKDFSEYVGREFGYLQVTRLLPRRTKLNGLMFPVEMECICRACGNVLVMRLDRLQSRTSCGCVPKKRNLLNSLDALKPSDEDRRMFAEHSLEPYIVRKLKAKYECEHPAEACVRSCVLHICCWDCDKMNTCGMACQNMPDKCGAGKRRRKK